MRLHVSRNAENFLRQLGKFTIVMEWDNTDPDFSGWVASVSELRGCMTEDDTVENTFDMLKDALTTWIECVIENGETAKTIMSRQQDLNDEIPVDDDKLAEALWKGYGEN
jgi:predicted RNase H-like HicB family nuclease